MILPPGAREIPDPEAEMERLAALRSRLSVPPAYGSLRWRTGRRVGRTVYAQAGPYPSDDDPLIGTMDTPELAEAAVRAHNAELAGA